MEETKELRVLDNIHLCSNMKEKLSEGHWTNIIALDDRML